MSASLNTPHVTVLEALAQLKYVARPEGSVTVGNASGVNDGVCAWLLVILPRCFGKHPVASQ